MPVVSARNLGITFDKTLILNIIYFSVTKTIATGAISSRFDYCNSPFHNIALHDIVKLVQNCLVRVFTRSPHFFHSVTPTKK